MTHWRSCTKQKTLLIYSPQADYIKHTLCSTYFGMRRALTDAGCSSATSQGRRCCEPPSTPNIWVTYGERGGQGAKSVCFQLNPAIHPRPSPDSSSSSFPLLLVVLCTYISHLAVAVTLPGLPPAACSSAHFPTLTAGFS